ncbi:hypothetical protein [Pontibacter actiniarum]|uniref:C4-dicarboxylate ABC transporter n=1 Tax=Pontibacter actiniarum TaxID=323450 RepID=A0A1X9YUU1_9BACT|nr:hypothetical protein [Pontibacter actiniarum]ARS36655.1 hypothetical protein CA264_15190 [Pontibacter actiniarum]
MLRPRKDDEKPAPTLFSKFARIFGLFMTLFYVALGLFIMFAGERLRLDIADSVKYMLGGVLILYGIVRFVRVYSSTRSKNNRYED